MDPHEQKITTSNEQQYYFYEFDEKNKSIQQKTYTEKPTLETITSHLDTIVQAVANKQLFLQKVEADTMYTFVDGLKDKIKGTIYEDHNWIGPVIVWFAETFNLGILG